MDLGKDLIRLDLFLRSINSATSPEERAPSLERFACTEAYLFNSSRNNVSFMSDELLRITRERMRTDANTLWS